MNRDQRSRSDRIRESPWSEQFSPELVRRPGEEGSARPTHGNAWFGKPLTRSEVSASKDYTPDTGVSQARVQ